MIGSTFCRFFFSRPLAVHSVFILSLDCGKLLLFRCITQNTL